MMRFRFHRPLNGLFLAMFLVYAISPLFVQISDAEDSLKVDRRGIKKLLIVDFMLQSLLNDDCEDDPAEDGYVLVKRKRAVLKRVDAVKPPTADVISQEIPDDIFIRALIETPRVDQKTNPKEFKGFLPLFSGLSPPIV